MIHCNSNNPRVFLLAQKYLISLKYHFGFGDYGDKIYSITYNRTYYDTISTQIFAEWISTDIYVTFNLSPSVTSYQNLPPFALYHIQNCFLIEINKLNFVNKSIILKGSQRYAFVKNVLLESFKFLRLLSVHKKEYFVYA